MRPLPRGEGMESTTDHRVVLVLTLLVAGLMAAAGCRTTMRPAAPVPGLDAPLQALFRVEYTGPRRGGSGKLTLRLWGEEDFLLDLRDPLGRQRWSLRSTAHGAWMAEASSDRYCRLTPGAVLAVTGWGNVPLRRLPHVLLGEAPIRELRAGAVEATTPEGRWRFTWRDGELVQWGLWRRARPLVWWRREEGGGVLSSARGEQLRWRERVREPMSALPAPASPPAGTEETSCEHLAVS